jgi:succinyl-diaminopimelate desuccinylase
VHKAGTFLQDLEARQPVEVEVGGHVFREVVSVTLASGGRARNVVPERFDLNLNYRFAPGKSLEEAQAEIETLVDGRAEVEFVDRSPAGTVVNSNPHYQRFSQLTQAPETAKQAWTDVARLAEAGIDAVNFGPGRSDQAHQAEEYAEISKLVASYQLFHRFLTAG